MKAKKEFYQNVDLRSKEEMINFLTNHFRYDTMNSWNASTSYANKVKVYSVIPNELENKVYEMMDSEDFYDEINWILSDFDRAHNWEFQAGFNGRSGGYIVLYSGGYKFEKTKDGTEYKKPFSFPGRSIDQNEDFGTWYIEDLRERVKLVQEFDRMCDLVVSETIFLAENCEVINEEYTETKTRKIINY